MKILNNDDKNFTNTKKFMATFVIKALAEFDLTAEKREKVYTEIMNDIPQAAEIFLEREGEREYKFSTYFATHIARRLKGLKKKNR